MINFQISFLENKGSCEKIVFHAFHLFSHIEWFPDDYLILFSPELAVFKHTR